MIIKTNENNTVQISMSAWFFGFLASHNEVLMTSLGLMHDGGDVCLNLLSCKR